MSPVSGDDERVDFEVFADDEGLVSLSVPDEFVGFAGVSSFFVGLTMDSEDESDLRKHWLNQMRTPERIFFRHITQIFLALRQ